MALARARPQHARGNAFPRAHPSRPRPALVPSFLPARWPRRSSPSPRTVPVVLPGARARSSPPCPTTSPPPPLHRPRPSASSPWTWTGPSSARTPPSRTPRSPPFDASAPPARSCASPLVARHPPSAVTPANSTSAPSPPFASTARAPCSSTATAAKATSSGAPSISPGPSCPVLDVAEHLDLPVQYCLPDRSVTAPINDGQTALMDGFDALVGPEGHSARVRTLLPAESSDAADESSWPFPPPLKLIVVAGSQTRADKVAGQAREMLSPDLCHIIAAEQHVEFLMPGANKATGLRSACEALGVSMARSARLATPTTTPGDATRRAACRTPCHTGEKRRWPRRSEGVDSITPTTAWRWSWRRCWTPTRSPRRPSRRRRRTGDARRSGENGGRMGNAECGENIASHARWTTRV